MSCPKKILLVESLGFAVIILLLGLDEFFDFPRWLLGAPNTPFNVREVFLESAVILVVAAVIMICSWSLARRLQRADIEKARLFGLISHDLRSPFTNLIGNAELLRKNFTELSEEERRSLSAGIFEAADQAHGLLENLLHWAEVQLESGGVPLSSCDLHELVAEVIDHVGLVATRKQLVITNGVPSGTLVDIDETAIRSVLRNLLSNAVKFSKPGTVIEVQTKGRGKKVRVSVVDRGVGMSRQELKGLFSMGTRLSKPGTAGETGSGLGLLLSQELIRRSGGRLKVRSDVGKGSTFTFALPKTLGARPVKMREEFE